MVLKWMGIVRSPDRGSGAVVMMCQSRSQSGNPPELTRYSCLMRFHPRSNKGSFNPLFGAVVAAAMFVLAPVGAFGVGRNTAIMDSTGDSTAGSRIVRVHVQHVTL